MKIKHLFFLAFILLACACSSDSDNNGSGIDGDSSTKDAVLTGTTWYYDDDFTPIDSYIDYDKIMDDIRIYLHNNNADSLYTAVIADYTINDTTSNDYNPSKIIFGNSRCELIDTTYTKVSITSKKFHDLKLTFKPGTYYIGEYHTPVTIDKNYITIERGFNSDQFRLNNGVYYYQYGNHTTSIENIKKDMNVNITTLDFTRDSDNIILSSENIKYQGTINIERGEIQLKQYSPIVGENRTFKISK